MPNAQHLVLVLEGGELRSSQHAVSTRRRVSHAVVVKSADSDYIDSRTYTPEQASLTSSPMRSVTVLLTG